MFKQGRNSNGNDANITEILCEQYLPRVFQYINYWLNDQETAEEMSLKAIKEAMARYGNCCRDERKLSTGIFKYAQKRVLDYLKMNNAKPILSGLSIQEQEVITLMLAAVLNNRMISKLLGLPESRVGTIVRESLCKLRDCMEVPA